MTALAEARVKRLVESGLLGQCRTSKRLRELRSRADWSGEVSVKKMEWVFAALGDETRLRILKLIGDEELCSCEVMAALELTQPTTSHHLGILEKAGLVSARREGKWVFYRRHDPKVEQLIETAQKLTG